MPPPPQQWMSPSLHKQGANRDIAVHATIGTDIEHGATVDLARVGFQFRE